MRVGVGSSPCSGENALPDARATMTARTLESAMRVGTGNFTMHSIGGRDSSRALEEDYSCWLCIAERKCGRTVGRTSKSLVLAELPHHFCCIPVLAVDGFVH